jgi:hypothetical protein
VDPGLIRCSDVHYVNQWPAHRSLNIKSNLLARTRQETACWKDKHEESDSISPYDCNSDTRYIISTLWDRISPRQPAGGDLRPERKATCLNSQGFTFPAGFASKARKETHQSTTKHTRRRAAGGQSGLGRRKFGGREWKIEAAAAPPCLGNRVRSRSLGKKRKVGRAPFFLRWGFMA